MSEIFLEERYLCSFKEIKNIGKCFAEVSSVIYNIALARLIKMQKSGYHNA